jgi:hypothetical protein
LFLRNKVLLQNQFMQRVRRNTKEITAEPVKERRLLPSVGLSDLTAMKRSNTKWQNSFVRYGYFLALLGLTDLEISTALDINPMTLTLWKRDKKDFKAALLRGRAEADTKVASSLYKSALGYSHPDTVILTNRVKEYDEKGRVTKEWTEPLLVPIVKRYPPNVQAAIHWLSTRHPDKWSATRKVQVSGHVTVEKINMQDFTEEELKLLEKIGINNLAEADYVDVEEMKDNE